MWRPNARATIEERPGQAPERTNKHNDIENQCRSRAEYAEITRGFRPTA